MWTLYNIFSRAPKPITQIIAKGRKGEIVPNRHAVVRVGVLGRLLLQLDVHLVVAALLVAVQLRLLLAPHVRIVVQSVADREPLVVNAVRHRVISFIEHSLAIYNVGAALGVEILQAKPVGVVGDLLLLRA